jgi:hypothetical protein
MPTGPSDAILRATRVAGAAVGLASLAAAAVTATLAGPARAAEQHEFSIRVTSPETTSNWAGYAATSAAGSTPITFTSATGTWKQAAATCTPGAGESASAVWVGLGGYSLDTHALEQIGADADCSASGAPSYYVWYELVPEPPVNLKLKVRPGDTLTASVNVTGGNQVWLQLKNRTAGVVFNKRVTISNADLSSAEWVVEAPSSCLSFSCRPVPLANFGSVAFSKIATTGDGHPGTLLDPAWSNIPMQLVPDEGRGFFPGSRGVRQTSSTAGTGAPTPTSDGRGFSVAWTADATASTASSG